MLNLVVAFAFIYQQVQAEDTHQNTKPQLTTSEVVPKHHRISAHIHIKAPVESVWQAIHEERNSDPDMIYSKVINQYGNESQLEQKFQYLPLFGHATCVLKNVEIPNQRIDYWLLQSDRFKAMEGSWILTSLDAGKTTMLELSTYVDLGIPLPRIFLDQITSMRLEKRIANVKKMAEHNVLSHKSISL